MALTMLCSSLPSGLDNAGKTTIVKRIMGEDVNSVSPTLGFIIKTIDYEGYDVHCFLGGRVDRFSADFSEDISLISVSLPGAPPRGTEQTTLLTPPRGCGRPEDLEIILEELL